MDINTKQRPVPSELLLDIKRLAENETDTEALLRDVFDLFSSKLDSPLVGLLSPSEKRRGKVSRVTFNAALRAVWDTLRESSAEEIYDVLSAYLHACMAGLRERKAQGKITNPTMFRALMLLFPIVAERVSDRHGTDYTSAHFAEIVTPFFERIRKTDLEKPGASHIDLRDHLAKALRSGFTIGSGSAA